MAGYPKEKADRTQVTTHRVGDLLTRFLEQLTKQQQIQGEQVLLAWPEVIGKQLAPMTRAVSFIDGVLFVKVQNATLYSLLSQYERPRLLAALKKRFPHAEIRALLFRIG